MFEWDANLAELTANPALPTRDFAVHMVERRIKNMAAQKAAGTGEEVLSVDIDLSAVDAWRESFPVLDDRRIPDHVR